MSPAYPSNNNHEEGFDLAGLRTWQESSPLRSGALRENSTIKVLKPLKVRRT